MANQVEICNRGLQAIGAKTIVDLEEGTPNADACNLVYNPIRLALLREHTWNFATKQAELAAEDPAPSFGRSNAYPLPSDFLRLLPPFPEDNTNTLDHQIQGKKIFTDDSSPIQIRYVYNVTDVNEMDALFREALAMKIGLELAEDLTNSSSKVDRVERKFDRAIRQAKRTNAILAMWQSRL